MQIDNPADNSSDSCLSMQAGFRVDQDELDRGIERFRKREISLEEVAREHLVIDVRLRGRLLDYFKEILQLKWERDTDPPRDLIKGKHFDDTSFDTGLPDPSQPDTRTVHVVGLGESTLRIQAFNPIGYRGIDRLRLRRSHDPAEEATLRDLLEKLAKYQAERPPSIRDTVDEDRIQQLKGSIDEAFFRGLRNPCLKVAHDEQVPQSFTLRDSERSRTRLEDGDPLVAPRVIACTSFGRLGAYPHFERWCMRLMPPRILKVPVGLWFSCLM